MVERWHRRSRGCRQQTLAQSAASPGGPRSRPLRSSVAWRAVLLGMQFPGTPQRRAREICYGLDTDEAVRGSEMLPDMVSPVATVSGTFCCAEKHAGRTPGFNF